ncbi:MAG: phosphate ABC transporter substrate-binding protein [Anaerosomatales bacterium]|nr:phosphate ABC transporter substrate-binding protein [Anaerosomatales bacterium]
MALIAVMLATIVVPLAGCDDGARAEDEVVVTGSTTILPIAEISAEDFTEENPGTKVLVSGVGSSAGIESVSKGTSDIGTASRDLKESELSLGLVDTPIAYDAIAVIVNPENPVRSLTREQVRDIFAGQITNWAEVGGPDLPVGIVNRDEASGTREAFKKIVMGDTDFDRTAVILPGTGQVRMVVGEAVGAVGYISVGFVNDDVAAVTIDGVEPTLANVLNGSYGLQRLLHFFTLGEPEGLTKEYIEYVLSPTVQETLVREAGFVPITQGDPPPDVIGGQDD